jgi:aminoglycoside 3-N-acetyltransferase
MKLVTSIKQRTRIWAKRVLPESFIHTLRKASHIPDASAKRAKRDSMPPLGVNELVDSLKAAGIMSGDVVMVHSSLSSIGNVSDGAETVIESLRKAVSTEGTVVMPCYGSADEALRHSKKGTPIDLRTAGSTVGEITEVFRTSAGVLRSSHPFSSCCAWGRQAAYITSGHEGAPQVCHADSPVGRLVKLRGKVVGIGIPIAQGLGVAHHLEDCWDGFPFEVHSENASTTYLDANGKQVARDVCRFDPEVAVTRIDYPEGKWICKTLTAHLARKGILIPFRLGRAESWVMDALSLYEEMKRLAKKNVTMYLTEDRLTDQNRDTENW